MLRDPVDRAYSQYWNDVREGLDRRSFLEALTEEQRSGPGAWGVSSLYIDCGRYADQVARYLDRFGAGVQVLFFEDFVRDEAGTIAQIHSFLGVQPAAADVAPRKLNPTSLPRNLLSGALLASGGVRRVVRATVPRSLRSRLRKALVKEASPPPMDGRARTLAHRDLPSGGRATGRAARQAAALGAAVASGSAADRRRVRGLRLSM